MASMHTNNSIERVLTIEKGHELSLHISDDIANEKSFMHPAYRQAMQAVSEIINQTFLFHNLTTNATTTTLNNALFHYSSNVIAFEGERGNGKTSTMLSFAKVLSSKTWHASSSSFKSFSHSTPLEEFCNCDFIELSPVAPAAQASHQSILQVILSRLYSYANELIHANHLVITDRSKIELQSAFQRCLSGINSMKESDDSDYTDDLSILQDISDGITLRIHFYELIECLLRIANPKQGIKNGFLILQIDDADSQIKNGYEVLENIRKYLMIPNLIILVSLDINMIQYVINEEYLSHLKHLNQLSSTADFERNISRISRKYIDKLIPPSHMIHLPVLEKCVEQYANQVTLLYTKKISNEATAVFPWSESGIWNIQDFLLMLIYRKTNVVFVQSSTALHNMIPRTLRGLNQFIHLLSSMEDIPNLDSSTVWKSTDLYVNALLNQTSIQEENLSRFFDYFMNDWIQVKIQNKSYRGFFNQLNSISQIDLISHTLRFFSSQYSHLQGLTKKEPTRTLLDSTMFSLEKRVHTQEEALMLFCIRTIFTLEGHRRVLRQKRITLLTKATDNLRTNHQNVIAFDFDPSSLLLPEMIDIPTNNMTGIRYIDSMNMLNSVAICNHEKEAVRNNYRFIVSCMVHKETPDRYKASYWGFITLLLRMGNHSIDLGSKTSPESLMQLQQQVHYMQELALLISLNWDIQIGFARKTAETVSIRDATLLDALPVDTPPAPVALLAARYSDIDASLKAINNNKLFEYLCSNLPSSDSNNKYSLRNSFTTFLLDSFDILNGIDKGTVILHDILGMIDHNDPSSQKTEDKNSTTNPHTIEKGMATTRKKAPVPQNTISTNQSLHNPKASRKKKNSSS